MNVKKFLYFLLMASPIYVGFLCLCIGSAHIPPLEIIKILFGVAYNKAYNIIIWDIRLPRILLNILVGSSLSVSGAILQSKFKNPLVDSYILGISSGAAFGASLAILLSLSLPFFYMSTFTFGILAVFFTLLLAGRNATPISLVLSGVIISALFSSLSSLLMFFMNPEDLASIVYWIMGSFSNTSWQDVYISAPVIIFGLILVYLMRWFLNVLSLGEEAEILGVDTKKIGLIFILLATLITSVSVSVCGIIGWVGFIVPHIVRMAFGPDHKTLIPLTITLGASFMILADTLARSLTSFEIPIGILTTIIGAPLFAYLLKKTAGVWK
ncbi:FecCD family ABC transporter permease [Methanocaldococcus infernus]